MAPVRGRLPDLLPVHQPAPVSGVFAGFEQLRIDGRDVWRGGTGPAVIVIHEMPGLHPGVVDFARRLVEAGFTAYLPSLFGTPGRPFSYGLYMGRSTLQVCVSREFAVFATNRTSPIVGWLRELAAKAHADCGGPGIGAVGMCFTGGFALAMAVDERMLAPVLSQPATPPPIGAARRAALGISDADLATVRQRTGQDGLCVLACASPGTVRYRRSASPRYAASWATRSWRWRSTPRPATRTASRRRRTPCSPWISSTSPGTQPGRP